MNSSESSVFCKKASLRFILMLQKPNSDFEDFMKLIGSLPEHRTYNHCYKSLPSRCVHVFFFLSELSGEHLVTVHSSN